MGSISCGESWFLLEQSRLIGLPGPWAGRCFATPDPGSDAPGARVTLNERFNFAPLVRMCRLQRQASGSRKQDTMHESRQSTFAPVSRTIFAQRSFSARKNA